MRPGDLSYARPAILDYGSLVELTAVTDLATGYDHSTAAADLSFSGQTGGVQGVSDSGTNPVASGAGGVQGVSQSGSSNPGGTSGGGESPVALGPGEAGSLPFTGYPAAAVAAAGGALTALGGALRRLTRRP